MRGNRELVGRVGASEDARIWTRQLASMKALWDKAADGPSFREVPERDARDTALRDQPGAAPAERPRGLPLPPSFCVDLARASCKMSCATSRCSGSATPVAERERFDAIHKHFFVGRRHARQPRPSKSGVALAILRGSLDPGAGAYWTTSSARPSSDCGIVRPSTLAALRLITSSNFVGCSTGRSAGLAPLRILST